MSLASRLNKVSASARASSARSRAASAGWAGFSASGCCGVTSFCNARAAPRRLLAGPEFRRSRGAISASAAATASARRSPPCSRCRSAASASSSPSCGASVVNSATAWRSQSSSRWASAIAARAASSAPAASRHAFQAAPTAARNRDATPYASSRRTWTAGSASPIWSPWPCTSTSSAPARRSNATPTGWSLIVARERPSRDTTRRTTNSSSSTTPCSASSSSAGCPAGGRKHAVTLACSAPARTRPLSARAPSASPRLSNRMLLPAPVSPVRTVSPASNCRSSRSISTTSRIDKAVSTLAAPGPVLPPWVRRATTDQAALSRLARPEADQGT